MADKPKPAPADQTLVASSIVSMAREGVHYPAVVVPGEAPRKGSTLRVTLENGVTYAGKVHATHDAPDGVLVETDGLEPEIQS